MKSVLIFCALLIVAVAHPPIQSREENSFSSVTEDLAKKAIVQTAKSLAQEAVDTAANIYHWARESGKSFGQVAPQPAAGKAAVKPAAKEGSKFNFLHTKSKRSPDPMIDELLRRRLESTFNELDKVLAPKRPAREEGNQAMSAFSSILSSIFSVLKSIPTLAPLIDMIKPFLAIAGINI